MTYPSGTAQRPLRLIWLQSGGCGGCTLSLLGQQEPDLISALRAAHVEVLWHPSLSEATGAEARAILDSAADGTQPVDILCLEGSVIHGPNGTGGFHLMAGTGRPMRDMIGAIAAHATHIIAVGSCAAFGGITAGGGNAVEAGGLAYNGTRAGGLLGAGFRARGGLPVINIAGCPIHPGWFVDTILQLADGTLSAADLDEWERPLAYTASLVHHGCARNEYYEFKASAEELGDLGCMMENLGCKGTQARADCNTRAWNGSGSCLSGGYPCINCTAPGFEDPGHSFSTTPKISGIPIGLPTDMPKAWFVALASLSKAATPRRLKENAARPTPAILPRDRRKEGA
ncbi:NiFe hydrogenase small subunit HydA [Novosphingobium sp. SG751A]|uniref:NADH-quinone oxidoreductase subunit B family protein n=1 Tax=Novosphingobium sp. SG751A TaxID=2587000 RepID=UPI001553A354|nr:HupU protein [Novosphingobium sp. SG751A]NOW44210.1 NiFe hydrogenase small subunit HydA [Novosphingobium sp. SG751A]